MAIQNFVENDTNMKKKKRSRERGKAVRKYDEPTILRYMSVLEHNDMNYNATSKEVGVTRQTLWKWKKKYWETYLENKNEVNDQIETIAAVKITNNKNFERVRNKLTDALDLAINRATEILNDKEKLEKMKLTEISDYVKSIAPYCVNKPVSEGADHPKDSKNPGHTTFMQNIIRELNVKGIDYQNKNIEHDNEQN